MEITKLVGVSVARQLCLYSSSKPSRLPEDTVGVLMEIRATKAPCLVIHLFDIKLLRVKFYDIAKLFGCIRRLSIDFRIDARQTLARSVNVL